MEEWQALTAYDWAFWLAGFFALMEFAKWLFSFKELVFEKIGIKTKGMLKREEYERRLKKVEDAIEEIKDTSKHNVNMFLDHEKQVVDKFTDIKNEIVVELNRLHNKIDEQTRESEETDCAMLRDRLNSAMRYFSQNKDEQGRTHISLADYETLDGLFNKYFAKHGNGAFKRMYEDEFEKFIIDR